MTRQECENKPSYPYCAFILTTAENFNQWLDLLHDCSCVAKVICDGRIVTRYSSLAKINLLLLLNASAKLASSMATLGRNEHHTSVSVIARSLLENYVSFKRLAESDVHAVYLTHASHEQQRSWFQARIDNPESAESITIAQALDELGTTLREVIDETIAKMRDFESVLPPEYFYKGKLKTGFFFRFELAGLTSQYKTFYKLLSSHSHGNVSSILAGATRSGEISWPPGVEPIPMLAVTLAVDLLTTQSLKMAELYRLADSAPVEELILRQRELSVQSPVGVVARI